MDVRGPTRAATRRLIQGVVTACAVSAVFAPVAGAATLTNVHPLDTPGTASYDDVTGTSTTLKLTGDASGTITVTDTAALEAVAGGLDGDETCLPPIPTDPPSADPTPPWTCTLAERFNVNLGVGDDTVDVGDNLPPLAINGGDGSDTVNFASGSGTKTVDLAAGTATGATLASIENVAGGPGGDTIAGDDSANVENGNGGNDALSGGAGADTLRGGSGINTLDGGAGEDNLIGGDSSDYIVAADGFADTIDCGGGNDTVVADIDPNGPAVDTFTNCESIDGKITATGDVGTTTTIQPVIVVPALGTPALTQTLAPGKANFADLTPPSASMRSFTRQRIKTVLNKGVPVRVTCKEACGISVALSVDRMTAKRLKLDARTSPVVVATGSAKRSSAGTTLMRVKFTKAAKKAMKKSKRGVVMTTQVLVSDASGNGTLLSRHVTLVR